MNFKRRRAKNRRAGCLLCKPHKANGADRRTVQEQRADQEHWSWSGLNSGRTSTWDGRP